MIKQEMFYKPRDFQSHTIENVHKSFYEAGIQRQLIVYATGLGKTILFVYLHAMIMPEEKSLFIVDRQELAFQTKKSIRKMNPEIRVGIEMNTYRATKDDDIVILSVDSFGKEGSKRIMRYPPDHFKKIFVDEAHVSTTKRYERVLNYFGASTDNLIPGNLLVGLTATPNRTDGIKLNKIFDDVTDNKNLFWGIENGWLTDVEIHEEDTGVDISGVKATRSDFDLNELSIALNVNTRNEQIVKAYDQHGNNKRSIVYCAQVAHAYDVAALFRHYGIEARTIAHNTPKAERREIIEAYHNDEIKVLTNFGTLTTGFDDTELGLIIMGRPMKSDLLFQQSLGRGPRPSLTACVDLWRTPEDRRRSIARSTKPYVKIVDLVDNFGSNNVISMASIAGLSNNVKIPDGKKLYKEVVEPLKRAQMEHHIDTSQVRSLDQIELVLRKKTRISMQMVKPVVELKKMTPYAWAKIGTDQYEISVLSHNLALLIKKNLVDRYELIQIDTNTGAETSLNQSGFGSLDGAINVADHYLAEHIDKSELELHKLGKNWRKLGVTEGQMKMVKYFLRPLIAEGIISVDNTQEYIDTGQPVVYIHDDFNKATKEPLNRGTLSNLINQYKLESTMKKIDENKQTA